MFKRLGRKGQSTLEYAVLIVVIIAALIAMQVYLKRGIQGKMRESADTIGEQFSPGITQGNKYTQSWMNQTTQSDRWSERTIIQNQWQNRSGIENVINASNEYWGH